MEDENSLFKKKHCVVLLCVCESEQGRNEYSSQNQCETFVKIYRIQSQRAFPPRIFVTKF
jgi:hypothetical protein